MKSLIYETPVESEEDLLGRVMAAADVGLPGIGDRMYQNMVPSTGVTLHRQGNFTQFLEKDLDGICV